MGKQSQAWKNLERAVAKHLKGRRVSRGDNFARPDVDVIIEDMPWLRIDAKYRTRHAHHTFMQEVLDKYCDRDGMEPVLVTKHHNQTGAYATIRLEMLGMLLDALRFVQGSKEFETWLDNSARSSSEPSE